MGRKAGGFLKNLSEKQRKPTKKCPNACKNHLMQQIAQWFGKKC
jgi:hypothetical protein